jgi:hypothetical protein
MFCVLYLASYHFFCACVVECLLHDCLSKKNTFLLEYKEFWINVGMVYRALVGMYPNM